MTNQFDLTRRQNGMRAGGRSAVVGIVGRVLSLGVAEHSCPYGLRLRLGPSAVRHPEDHPLVVHAQERPAGRLASAIFRRRSGSWALAWPFLRARLAHGSSQ